MADKYYDMGAMQAFYDKIKTLFQTVANKVTSWSTTPSDDKYPSEKLVKTQQDEIIKKAYGAQGFISSSAANAEIFAERTLMGSWSLNNRNGSVRVQLYRYADGNEDNATLVWDSNTATGDVKESFLNAKQTGTLLTTDPGECAKVVYTGSTSSYFRAIGIYLNVKVADASHTVSANLRIGTTNYPTYSVSTWGSLVTAIASDGAATSATVLFRPNQSTGQMCFYGFRCLNTYSEGGTLIGTADTSLKLKTSRKLAVSLSNTSTDTSFDGSADVTNIKTTGTLGIANGGTGATTAIGAEYNILNQVADIDTTINGDRKIALCNQTKSASNGVFRWLKLSNVWTWIKGLLSSESGVNISGNAATATTATTAAGYTSGGAIDTALQGKVDTAEGKGLSTNDFTDTYKSDVDSNTSARHTHSNKSVLDSISFADVNNWDGKQDDLGISSSGDATKFLNEKGLWATPTGTAQVQSDWNQTTDTAVDYIKNKPTIPAAANNATITIQGEGTNIDSFTVDASSNKSINITKSSLGLGNVDNTSDTTKKTNFTGAVADGDTGFPTGDAVYDAIVANGKGIVIIDTSYTQNDISSILSAGKVPIFKAVAGQGYKYYQLIDDNSAGYTFAATPANGIVSRAVCLGSTWTTGLINVEDTNNKVSSWSSTTDNTHYPTEKLVKDSLDGKVSTSNFVQGAFWEVQTSQAIKFTFDSNKIQNFCSIIIQASVGQYTLLYLIGVSHSTDANPSAPPYFIRAAGITMLGGPGALTVGTNYYPKVMYDDNNLYVYWGAGNVKRCQWTFVGQNRTDITCIRVTKPDATAEASLTAASNYLIPTGDFSAIGSSGKPVYINENGKITECSLSVRGNVRNTANGYIRIKCEANINYGHSNITIIGGYSEYGYIYQVGFRWGGTTFSVSPVLRVVSCNNEDRSQGTNSYIPTEIKYGVGSDGCGYIFLKRTVASNNAYIITGNANTISGIIVSAVTTTDPVSSLSNGTFGHGAVHTNITGTAVGSATRPVWVSAGGKVEACTYGIAVGYSSANNTICFY